jgi:hypothetical protein
MSNCIKIEWKYQIDFRPHEIDGAGLAKAIEQANRVVNHENCVKMEEEGGPSNHDKVLWWFLTGNTQIRKTGAITIRLGEGRSTHTNRDFRATLHFLSQYVKVDKWQNFGITDEYDNYKTICRVPINLKTGRGKND